MNKPRLIDANELYKLIEENSYTLVDRINSKDKGMFLVGIKEAIDKSPTAYDIDKVVEQLEALPNINQNYHSSTEMIDRDDAIEIVKGGLDGSRNDSTSR